MTHLDRFDLTPQRLSALFDAAAIAGRIEEDGDLYLAGEGVDYPLWLSVSADKGHVRLFTFAALGPTMNDQRALAYANKANGRWHWCTFAAQRRDGAAALCADHSLMTQYGIDGRTLIATARAFSAVFRRAIDRERIAGFLTSSGADDGTEDDAGEDRQAVSLLRH